MKKLLLLFIALSPLFSIAQKCKFEKEEVDPFTKEQIVLTNAENFGVENWKRKWVNVQGFKKGNQNFLRMTVLLGHPFAIDNSEIWLLDKQENITKFSISEFKTSNPGLSDAHYIQYNFPLTVDQLANLIDNEFTFVRFQTTDGYVDVEVPKKRNDKIGKVLNCILEK